MSISVRATVDYSQMELRGKNPFIGVNSEKVRRRSSQFERALHRFYREPNRLCANGFLHQIFIRIYWSIRSIQFRLFYKDEEIDLDDVIDAKAEHSIQPPPLAQLALSTSFNPRWIKYFYTRFKNECPSGRMRETDFRRIIHPIFESNQSSHLYISKLFAAFSSDPAGQIVTFHDIIECLAFLAEGTPEVRATWTIRMITGNPDDHFQFPEFASFTSAVFSLGDSCEQMKRTKERETNRQRAITVFKELDSDQDGIVTKSDLVRMFRSAKDTNPNIFPAESEEVKSENNETYIVLRTLGSGAFGAVFEVKTKSNEKYYALKCEALNCKKPMHMMECKVLANAKHANYQHFLDVIDRGKVEKRFNFIVMQLLGRNLWDLRACREARCFSLPTALRASEQCLASIRDLHEIGFLHRDIKPPNFAVGREEDKQEQVIFILDFGLSRKYWDKNNQLRRPRSSAPFRGTTRYASRGALKMQEQSRKDDVEAWFYMTLEFTTGNLPWKHLKGKERDKVLQMKNDFRQPDVLEEALSGAPIREYRRILRYIDGLAYESIPDYDGIYMILRKIANANNIPEEQALDWCDQPYNGPHFLRTKTVEDVTPSSGQQKDHLPLSEKEHPAHAENKEAPPNKKE